MTQVKQLALAAILAVVLTAPSTAHAGPAIGETSSSPQILLDMYYDWEVWVAAPTIAYYVVVEYYDGTFWKTKMDTLSLAQSYANLLKQERIIKDAWVEPRIEPGTWHHVDTVDTLAQALAYEATWGYYTDIVPVKAYPWSRLQSP